MSTDQPTSTRPLTYVIIPLLAIFVVCSAFLFFHIRRRRRRLVPADGWARGRWVTRDGTIMFIPRHYRRNPWGGFHSSEGLNELGEAPPPYKFKVVTTEEVEAAAGAGRPTELRDLEEGRRPPEYIAEPPPAVTTESRRTVV
ncbi:hypothetical protein Trihar35433_6963 [Trichoderma harzianum]|nr:hypothetical protein Trihar35433_6963 [Trichoderma harzianum]